MVDRLTWSLTGARELEAVLRDLGPRGRLAGRRPGRRGPAREAIGLVGANGDDVEIWRLAAGGVSPLPRRATVAGRR